MSSRPLTQLLAEISEDVFWVPETDPPKPAYNQIFAEIVRIGLGLEDHDAKLKVRDIYGGRIPNLSSFQRAVAKEAADRRERPESGPVPPAGASPEPLPRPKALLPSSPVADRTHRKDLAERIRAQFPRGTAENFVAHVRAAAPSAEALRTQVETYLKTLPHELVRNEFLDIELARDIGRACLELIDATKDADSEDRILVAAAVAYFVDPDDDEHDHQSSIGFFDDAEVVSWAISQLRLAVLPPTPDVLK